MENEYIKNNLWIKCPDIFWIRKFITNPIFFSKDNLSFFHQTMNDFKVVLRNGRLFFYAPDTNALNTNKTFYTFREVLVSGDCKEFVLVPLTCENEVIGYIKTLTEGYK
jgi:hypothetical protein